MKNKNKKLLKNVIALLTVNPNYYLLDFYYGFVSHGYEVYCFIDNNEADLTEYKHFYPDITFIKIKEEDCYKRGYYNVNYTIKYGKPSSWDKALLYFCDYYHHYKNIWFVEDDVFIPSYQTIINIDKEYQNNDLLIRSNHTDKNWFHYQIVLQQLYENKKLIHDYPDIEKYMGNSMVCAIRCSQHYMTYIKEFVKKYKKMYFLEVFLILIANLYHIPITIIPNLQHIQFRYNWLIQNIEEDFLYHPIKDPYTQFEYHKLYIYNSYLVYPIDKKEIIQNIKKIGGKEINYKIIQLISFHKKRNNNNHNNNDIQKYEFQVKIENKDIYIQYVKRYKQKIFIEQLKVNDISQAIYFLTKQGYSIKNVMVYIEQEFRYQNQLFHFLQFPGVNDILFMENITNKNIFDILHIDLTDVKDITTVDEIKTYVFQYLKSVGIHYNEKYSLLFKNIFQYYLKNNKNKNKKINKNRILKTYTEQNKIYQNLLKKHNIKIININRYR